MDSVATGADQRFCGVDRGHRQHPRLFDRTRCVLAQLSEKLRRILESDRLPPGDQVLDYGCGNKPYRSLLSLKFKHYIGADLAGNTDADLTLLPGGKIPAPEETFDCILSSQVLEHVTSPHAYLKEARRVLKPGGYLILSTHGIWPYHPDPVDYWRWTIDGLQLELRKAGFEPILIQSILGLASSALQLWQDATFERLPRFIRPLYIGVIQFVMACIERRHPDTVSPDGSVYLILAQKADAPTIDEDAGSQGSSGRASDAGLLGQTGAVVGEASRSEIDSLGAVLNKAKIHNGQ